MILLVLLFVDTLATPHNDAGHALRSYDSYEWQVSVSEPTAQYSVSRFWWEMYTTVSTTPAWWSSIKTNITTTTETTASADVQTTEFDPIGNMSLSPQEAIDMFSDLSKLNATVVEQSKKLFGEDKPELHDLVYKWIFQLVNRTKVDNNTIFITTTPNYQTLYYEYSRDDTLRNKVGHEINPESLRFDNQGRTPLYPGLQEPPGSQGPRGIENVNQRLLPGYQGVSLGTGKEGPGVHERYPSQYNEESKLHQAGPQDLPPDYHDGPPGRGLAPSFQGYPSGSQVPGSGGYPPGFQGYPPGPDGVPSGSQGMPQNPQRFPGPEGVPDSQGYPPVPEGLPAGPQGIPPNPQGIPPGLQGYPPGPEGVPGSQGYPSGFQGYPPVPEGLPAGPQGMPPNPQGIPPGLQGYPPGPEGVPGSQRYPSGFQGYPPVPEGLPAGPQGMPPNPQGIPPGPQGYPPGSEGVPGSQGYPPGPQEYPPVSGPRGHPGQVKQNNGYPWTNEQKNTGQPNSQFTGHAGIQNHQVNPGRQFTETMATTTTVASIPTTLPAPDVERQLPPEYHDMFERPDYEEMANTDPQPPDLVNDAANSILLVQGIPTPVTTTSHPLVSSLNKEMVAGVEGYFSTFLSKLLELLATKENEQTGHLVMSADMIVQDLDRKGSIRFLGSPFEPSILKVTQAMSGMPPEVIKSHATLGHRILSERHRVLPKDTNDIIRAVDSMFLFYEGQALFASLAQLHDYPENNATSGLVMKVMIEALLAPFNRLKNSQQLKTTLNMINIAIADKFPYRKSNLRGYRDVDAEDRTYNKLKAFRAKVESRTIYGKFKAQSESTERKEQGTYKHFLSKDKNLKFTRKIRIDSTAVTNTITARRKSKNADVRNKKKSRNKLKTEGLNIETDRDFTLDKHEHKAVDFKKHVKNKIKKHLKNKHRELYDNYRNKHKQAKKLAEEQKNEAKDRPIDGHYYEKLIRNRFIQEDESNTVFEVTIGKPQKVTRTPLKSLQKRFNVVNSVADSQNTDTITSSTKLSQKNNKGKSSKEESNTEESKYLSKYKHRNKADRLDKNINKTSKKDIFEDSSSVDDEKDLKFNLQDTLRHGDRKFIERRNYENKKRMTINELSSYSDEEGVLKNNIYKVFGYTHGLI